MVGQGAFGRKHLDGLKNIDGVEVVSLVGRSPDSTEAVAKQYGIPHWTSDLDEALAQPGVDAAIITSPTQVHAEQAVQVMRAGKHVEIEIPMADNLADAEQIHRVQQETGVLIAMAGHTRRFNPSHQWIHKRIRRRAEAPAAGRADLFLPPLQHQPRRASRAAGPITCSGTMPATRSTCSSTRPARRPRTCSRCRGPCIRNSASRWT
jgi:predicted dehydrogenase